MKTLFVLFVISNASNGGVGFTYEFTNKKQCEAVATLITEQSYNKFAFCTNVTK